MEITKFIVTEVEETEISKGKTLLELYSNMKKAEHRYENSKLNVEFATIIGGMLYYGV